MTLHHTHCWSHSSRVMTGAAAVRPRQLGGPLRSGDPCRIPAGQGAAAIALETASTPRKETLERCQRIAVTQITRGYSVGW